ncbi:MAG: Crp/Fnr family transcriptional regulator [Alphaproteobacteria bacterium]|nr:Crp/Fnr family transcriptional regulator [Alphaproteobacteria bacterium]
MMSNDFLRPLPNYFPEGRGPARYEQYDGRPAGNAVLPSFMAEHGTTVVVNANRSIPADGSQGFRFGLVQSGILLTTIDLPNDRRQVLCFYCPGDLVFVDAFNRGKAIRFRALGAVTIVGLNEQSLVTASEHSVDVRDTLMFEATRQINGLMLHNAALGRLRSEERLATFFLELALRIGEPSHDTVGFELRMRRDDIADYLSMNRDTLSRSMSKLKRNGTITFVNPNFVIAKWKALGEATPLATSMLRGVSGARVDGD